MPNKTALFRCEASSTQGAGHAMRCSVLADALLEKGWACAFITSQETYDFISTLSRFERIDPDKFYATPTECDLLVIDHYDLDASYEGHFRPYAKKMMVIDDLADRTHDCDILLDQTYGRSAEDYRSLVPQNCEILAGSEYVLLRPEFALLRSKALEKRKNTTEIRKILVTMGGSDPKNFTLKALNLIKDSEFKGDVDIVLGFSAPHREQIKAFAETMPNRVVFHVNADMPQLIYAADLAIGAGGTSVWERCCLGLPQVLFNIAPNQEDNLTCFENAQHIEKIQISPNAYEEKSLDASQIDGLGVKRVLHNILNFKNKFGKKITHRKIKKEDCSIIYSWQQDPNLRQHSFVARPPEYEEHLHWFSRVTSDKNTIFEIIMCENEPCGTLRLDYNRSQNALQLSWYIIHKYSGKGIGSLALEFSKELASGLKIYAYSFKENLPSNMVLKKAGFNKMKEDDQGSLYVF